MTRDKTPESGEMPRLEQVDRGELENKLSALTAQLKSRGSAEQLGVAIQYLEGILKSITSAELKVCARLSEGAREHDKKEREALDRLAEVYKKIERTKEKGQSFNLAWLVREIDNINKTVYGWAEEEAKTVGTAETEHQERYFADSDLQRFLRLSHEALEEKGFQGRLIKVGEKEGYFIFHVIDPNNKKEINFSVRLIDIPIVDEKRPNRQAVVIHNLELVNSKLQAGESIDKMDKDAPLAVDNEGFKIVSLKMLFPKGAGPAEK